MLGGSKTTVTLRFPQLGRIKRDSSLESGKFGPRAQTSATLKFPNAQTDDGTLTPA